MIFVVRLMFYVIGHLSTFVTIGLFCYFKYDEISAGHLTELVGNICKYSQEQDFGAWALGWAWGFCLPRVKNPRFWAWDFLELTDLVCLSLSLSDKPLWKKSLSLSRLLDDKKCKFISPSSPPPLPPTAPPSLPDVNKIQEFLCLEQSGEQNF